MSCAPRLKEKSFVWWQGKNALDNVDGKNQDRDMRTWGGVCNRCRKRGERRKGREERGWKKKCGHHFYSSLNTTLVAVQAKTTTVPLAFAPSSSLCPVLAQAFLQLCSRTDQIWLGIPVGSIPWSGSLCACQSAGASTTQGTATRGEVREGKGQGA